MNKCIINRVKLFSLISPPCYPIVTNGHAQYESPEISQEARVQRCFIDVIEQVESLILCPGSGVGLSINDKVMEF